uniref:Uncharacterized protein n=1 Tax=Photobacterium damselae subsp. damselae TaxID=85581 RepID=E4WLF2_PHODD|nr:hypothetical protein [Photobacterium damselae subsp. damselae]
MKYHWTHGYLRNRVFDDLYIELPVDSDRFMVLNVPILSTF